MEQNKRIEAQRRLGVAERRSLNIVLVSNLVVLLGGLALLYCGQNGIIGVTGLWVGLIVLIAALIMTVAFYMAFRRTVRQAARRIDEEAVTTDNTNSDEADDAGSDDVNGELHDDHYNSEESDEEGEPS